MRVGILGGIFNPPHIGHIALAQEARIQLGLDHVRLIPTGSPPHRLIDRDPGAIARYEMCVRAIEYQPGLRVSRLEIDRGESTAYTVDTVKMIDGELPRDRVVLIIGADQALKFHSWHRAAEIVRLADIAVAARRDLGRQQINESMRTTLGIRPEFVLLPRIDISSSDVRDYCAQGKEISHLVPPGVAQMIDRERFYR